MAKLEENLPRECTFTTVNVTNDNHVEILFFFLASFDILTIHFIYHIWIGRVQSLFVHLLNFNNWLATVLISLTKLLSTFLLKFVRRIRLFLLFYLCSELRLLHLFLYLSFFVRFAKTIHFLCNKVKVKKVSQTS